MKYFHRKRYDIHDFVSTKFAFNKLYFSIWLCWSGEQIGFYIFPVKVEEVPLSHGRREWSSRTSVTSFQNKVKHTNYNTSHLGNIPLLWNSQAWERWTSSRECKRTMKFITDLCSVSITQIYSSPSFLFRINISCAWKGKTLVKNQKCPYSYIKQIKRTNQHQQAVSRLHEGEHLDQILLPSDIKHGQILHDMLLNRCFFTACSDTSQKLHFWRRRKMYC